MQRKNLIFFVILFKFIKQKKWLNENDIVNKIKCVLFS